MLARRKAVDPAGASERLNDPSERYINPSER
jgi:hypothetical protein